MPARDRRASAARPSGARSSRPRSGRLDPATLAALEAQRARQDEERAFFGPDYLGDGHVFTWQDGRPVHPDVMRQRFARHVTDVGLPKIRLHDLRHSYATAALAAGISPKIVSERLGHASVAFTLTQYTHLLPGLDRDAAHTVAAVLLGPTPPPDAASEGASGGSR